jgi:hypothetical protein
MRTVRPTINRCVPECSNSRHWWQLGAGTVYSSRLWQGVGESPDRCRLEGVDLCEVNIVDLRILPRLPTIVTHDADPNSNQPVVCVRHVRQFGNRQLEHDALLVSAWFGPKCVALAYSGVALIYAPRSLMLILPLVGVSISSYLEVLIKPTKVAFAATVGYLALSGLAHTDRRSELCLAAFLPSLQWSRAACGNATPVRGNRASTRAICAWDELR